MRKHATGTHVRRAESSIVVNVGIRRNGGDVERRVTLFFLAISIQLRRQWRARSLQSFAQAFAILAAGFATEVGRAVVFAIGGCHAFGRHTAAAAIAAAAASSRPALSTISTAG